MIAFKGYHGTDIELADKITSTKFKISKGNSHWLGDGVYAFTGNTYGCSMSKAIEWGVSEAWDNYNKEYKYKKVGALEIETEVHEDKFLDLNTDDGRQVFEFLRDQFLAKIISQNKRLKTDVIQDGKIINTSRVLGIIEIDVVQGNFYIKFADQRKYQLSSKIPNCTICAIYNVDECIKKITLVDRKEIP